LSPAASLALCPDFFNDTFDCSQSMEMSIFRTGQNEVKRYKDKQVESTVPNLG
jgi:hypothetical protein